MHFYLVGKLAFLDDPVYFQDETEECVVNELSL